MHANSRRSSTRVLFLRHGHTDFPKDRFYDDKLEDPTLNPLGLKQAGLWTTQLNLRKIVAVYVSPSRRTQETARIATACLGLPLEVIEGLGERRFGAWGGLSSREVKEKFPEEWHAWREDNVHFTPSGGESLSGFSRRVDETIHALRACHPEQTFLAVTHAGQIRMIVASALGVPLKNFKRLVIRNGSMTEIEYTDRWPNLHTFSFIPGNLRNEEGS